MGVDIELIDHPGQWRTVRAARLLALRNSPEASGSPFERAERFSERDWRAEVSRRVWFIAAADGDVLGVAAGAWSTTVDAETLLEAMWVSQHARRRGAATQPVAQSGSPADKSAAAAARAVFFDCPLPLPVTTRRDTAPHPHRRRVRGR